MDLYTKVQELKDKINAGLIGPHTALDLLYMEATKPQAFPAEDQPDWIKDAKAPDPVPEPAPVAPADEPPADEVAE